MGATTRNDLVRPLIAGGVLVLLLAATSVAWWLLRPKPGPDMEAVLQLNNLGVGQMEQFEYDKAVAAFEEVNRLAPEWLPGKINLGIALTNYGGKIQPTTQQDEKEKTAAFKRALTVFAEVLARDPDNPHAHFCTGLILYNRGKLTDAALHFRATTVADANDAAAWCWLGKSVPSDEDRTDCFRRAVGLDPQLSSAIYGLSQCLRRRDPQAAERELEKFKALKDEDYDGSTRGNFVGEKYTEQGKHASVIGRPPGVWSKRTGPIPLFRPDAGLHVNLHPGARWATSRDFRGSPIAELRGRARARFGATMVVLDYDRDGRPDVLMLGAVVEGGAIRDLLLRNEGDGRFTDVTHEVGLAGNRPSLGCCVADFDDDDYPDLFITGAGEQHLFRNVPDGKGGRRFEDVSAASGLDKLRTICLGASFADLDQDGDLDLIVCQYTTLDHVAGALRPGKPPPGAGLAIYVNVGEAPPRSVAIAAGGHTPLLNPRFQRAEGATIKGISGLLGPGAATMGVAISDIDHDHDLDVVVLADQSTPVVAVNDRLLRFHQASLPPALAKPHSYNGALVLDADHDGRSDLFLIGPEHAPVLLLNRMLSGESAPERSFAAGYTNSPALLQAHAVDLDLDGYTDVVGLSAARKPVFVQNDGRRLVLRHEALGLDEDWPPDLVALAVAGMGPHGRPDLLLWSETQGLIRLVNEGNSNHGLWLRLTGLRWITTNNNVLRTNADGAGSIVVAHAGDVWGSVEYTTLSAGLGQSSQPLWIGLGRHAEADVVRVRWLDQCVQAEFHKPTDQLARIEENNRKPGSCPILFTWDGERYLFITDFLGAGSIGEMQPDGECRMPRPEEAVKIEPKQLRPRDGYYVLKLAEPMNEVTYLDRLQLVVVDHPGDVRVYPDERFTGSGPPATQDLLAFRREIFPVAARDHHGRDVTQKLRSRDRDTVDGFARRAWLGYAEEHWTELDFGEQLAKFGPRDRLVLCLAGWTDYPYPESIWGATQAGIPLQPPVLERLGSDGKWRTLVADVGFPAGMPRMMTLDVSGLLGGDRCVLRLRTNMQVFWDQIFVAPLVARVPEAGRADADQPLRLTRLSVADATLSPRGCMREYSPDGRQPTIYDYDRLEDVPVAPPAGRRTRFGDVTSLLRETDDRFVIFGPGDEVTARFDARQLPPLPFGWTRSFILKTWGYCKDSGPFTATGATIEPLPFRGMRRYPYGPDEHYPADLRRDERESNTRLVVERP
jgi:hypothetical protein